MSKVVRLEDPSDHGGYMLSATGKFVNNGIRVCVDGDMHVCPKRGHGTTAVTGTSSVTSGGKRVVKVGDVAGCGAVITSGGSVELG